MCPSVSSAGRNLPQMDSNRWCINTKNKRPADEDKRREETNAPTGREKGETTSMIKDERRA